MEFHGRYGKKNLAEAVVATLAIMNSDLNTITNEEWSELEDVVKILQIFDDVTVESSAEFTVSISKVLVFVRAIIGHISEESFPSGTLQRSCCSMIVKIREEVQRRFKNIEDNEILNESTFLDPRFKKFGFSSDAKFDNTYRTLIKKVSSLEKAVATAADDAQPSPLPLPLPSSSENILWKDFDARVQQTKTANPTAASIIEIDRFLQEPLLSRSKDPLEWWNARRTIYPLLYEYMKKRLCVVATSVPCERLFSKAGQVLTERRNRLKSTKVSQVLFLNSNLE